MAKQDGGRISKQFLCNIWKKRDERTNVGGVSIRNRNGAPSRKGCVVNGQITKASNQLVRPPPLVFLVIAPCPRDSRYEEAERIEEMLKNGSLEGKVAEKEAVAA